MDDEARLPSEGINVWCEEIVEAIMRRTAVTYTINEILKTNTKTLFTEAAIVYLKEKQAECNRKIAENMYILLNGHTR